MFDIFVKRKKIVLDFFTLDSQVYQDGKPVEAIKVLPDWFVGSDMKALQRTARMGGGSTIRKCPGLIDLYKNSFALTSWFNAEINISAQGDVKMNIGRYGEARFDPHIKPQYEPFVKNTNSQNFKLSVPWAWKCNKSINFMLMEPTWDSYKKYECASVLPGILNRDLTWQCNINYLTRPGNGMKNLTIHPGDPLAMMVPLTEDKVEMRTHLVTMVEARKERIFRHLWGIEGNPDHESTYHFKIEDKLRRIHNEDRT